MANNQIVNPFKINKMTKKQRQLVKKNHFSLGFDPGFTKSLLADSKTGESSKSNLILKRTDLKKKKNLRKKSDNKVNKQQLLKKKKKSVWDL